MAKSPSGTCNCIGLWFDLPQDLSAIAAVRRELLALGAREQEKPWTTAPGIEFDYRYSYAHQPGDEMYRALMLHKQLGPLSVQYEGTRESGPPAQHPVRLDFQNPWDGPEEFLDGTERNRLRALEKNGGKLMRALCDALDPAYAIHGGDATSIPAPMDLRTGFATLGWDFYVSRRLVGEVNLPGGKTEEWTHGTHVSTTTPYAKREAYNAADKDLSRSLGRTLTRPKRL